jgi:hypothetical protein
MHSSSFGGVVVGWHALPNVALPHTRASLRRNVGSGSRLKRRPSEPCWLYARKRTPQWRSWLPYPIDPPQDLYAEIYGSLIEVLRRNAARVRQVADVLLRDGEISELQLSPV